MTALRQRRLVLRLDRPSISFRVGVGSLLVLVATLAATAAFLTVGVGSGDYPLTIPQVLDALAGGADDRAGYVVWELRLPRLLTAVLVGASLALSGHLFQSIARNPLVAPDIIGVNGGAAVGALAVIVFGLPSILVGPAALAGALVAGGVLAALAWSGATTGQRLVLIGIGMAALAEAAIGYLLTRGDLLEVAQATVWLVGSLGSSSWGDVTLVGASLALLVPVTLAFAGRLGALELGDDAATALGVETGRTRLVLLVVAIALSAFAVAAAGPIAFVAFLAPNLARRLARSSGSGMLAASMAIGALLVLGADMIARRIVDPTELPVGIVTVVLGGPYFLALLLRADRVGATA